MSIIDNFSDLDFIRIISNSTTWKQIEVEFGYKNTLSSNLKKKIINRCNDLGIRSPEIKLIPSIDTYTKGELFNSRKNWLSARTAIRKSAKKVFEKSNKIHKCAICGYDKHIEIAHIKAVSEFEDSTKISEINAIDNLIALCPNHHWEYDNKILKL